MDENYLISIWKKHDETDAHKCIEEIYKKKGFHVKNYHSDDRINENGVDILCRKDDTIIGFSIKKKPRKGDIDQLRRFVEKNPDMKKYYIHLDHPTAPFEKEKSNYKDVTYWDWKIMHKELVENASKRYILLYFSIHPLFSNLFEIFKILYDNHEVHFSQGSASRREIEFLWNIKDDAVKLKAILHYVKEEWDRILMNKTYYNPDEYLEYIEKIHSELDLANSMAGRVLHTSFKKMEAKFPYLLSRYWDIVGRRTRWKEFVDTTIHLGTQSDNSVKEYILCSWVLPDLEEGYYAHVMKGFYSTLHYLLENISELAKDLEDGVDWLFSDIFDPNRSGKSGLGKILQ
jgi:hypothetical protein